MAIARIHMAVRPHTPKADRFKGNGDVTHQVQHEGFRMERVGVRGDIGLDLREAPHRPLFAVRPIAVEHAVVQSSLGVIVPVSEIWDDGALAVVQSDVGLINDVEPKQPNARVLAPSPLLPLLPIMLKLQ